MVEEFWNRGRVRSARLTEDGFWVKKEGWEGRKAEVGIARAAYALQWLCDFAEKFGWGVRRS